MYTTYIFVTYDNNLLIYNRYLQNNNIFTEYNIFIIIYKYIYKNIIYLQNKSHIL